MRHVRHPLPLLLAAVAAGCAGNTDDPTVVEGTIPLGPPVIEDTGWPPGDLGNFHLAYHGNTGKAEVTVVASAAQPGFLNFSQCAVRGVPCLGGIPQDEDDFKDIDLDQDIEREEVETRFLGFEIEYGPYTLTYKEDPNNGFGYYGADVDIEDLPEDRLIAPTWGGQWKEYEGEGDLFVSRPIQVLNPAPGQNITFTNGEMLPLEWVPTGEGVVTLLVSTPFGIARLFHLEDDGYYEVDVDDLGIPNIVDDVTFSFMRWNLATLRTYGHVVDLVANSDTVFTGQYYNIGSREKIEPADGCVEASGLPALESGAWWGWLGGKQNDLDDPAFPNNQGCLDEAGINPDGADAAGTDAIVRIDVGPHQNVAVDYNTYEESASVYLLRECDDENSCVDGSDLLPDPDQHELVNYFNYSDESESLFLVLDSNDPGPTVFTLDLEITDVPEPPMFDTCIEAREYADYPLLAPGNYYSEFAPPPIGYSGPWTSDTNPGAGGCTGTSVGGAEAMTPIEVGPGQTLSVGVEMPGSDPAIYFVDDCGNALATCQDRGWDLRLDAFESGAWTNNGGSAVIVYVVVDTKGSVNPYFMTVGL